MVNASATDAFGNFDLGQRIMELVSGGSNGERVVRGFLMGVAVGIILGGALCCWVPCFGRRQQERRARRRQAREAAQRQAQGLPPNETGQADGQTTGVTGTETETEPAADGNNHTQTQTQIDVTSQANDPDSDGNRFAIAWQRMRRRVQ